jgi:hypothetical protein
VTNSDDDDSWWERPEWVPRPDGGWPPFQFDCGYISEDFITDDDRQIAVLDQPYILIHKETLSDELLRPTADPPSIEGPLELLLVKIIRSDHPLLIIAKDVQASALAMLLLNKVRGAVRVAAVRVPGSDDYRSAFLALIARLTGGKVVTELLGRAGPNLANVTLAHLGRADRVLIGEKKTAILGGGAKKLTKTDVRRLWPANAPGDGGSEAAKIPGASQPTLSDSMAPQDLPPNGWLNLWQFARSRAPKTCRIVSWWVGMGTIPVAVIERAKAHLMTTDPSIISAVARIRARLSPRLFNAVG